MSDTHSFNREDFDRLVFNTSLKYDLVCFGLNDKNEVENKFDMVFFNQYENHNKSIELETEDVKAFNKRASEFRFSFNQIPSYVKSIVIYAVNLEGEIEQDFYRDFKCYVSNLNNQVQASSAQDKLMGSLRIAKLTKDSAGRWVVDLKHKGCKYDLLGLADIHGVRVHQEDRDNHRETELDQVMKEAGLTHFIERKAEFHKEIHKNVHLSDGTSYSAEEIINEKNRFVLVLDLSLSMEKAFLNNVHQRLLEVLSFISFLTEDELSVELWVQANECKYIGNLSSRVIGTLFQDIEEKKDKYDYSLFPGIGVGNNTSNMIRSVLNTIDEEPKTLIVHLTDFEGIPDTDNARGELANLPYNAFWQTIAVLDEGLDCIEHDYGVASIKIEDAEDPILLCEKLLSGWKFSLAKKAIERQRNRRR